MTTGAPEAGPDSTTRADSPEASVTCRAATWGSPAGYESLGPAMLVAIVSLN
ncbi:MAG: hypothetical protein M3081_17355 [Gemmatimonadota bacterium]|nr:hypothetical protein [Gemmatimonadota bacterium]